MDPVDRKAPFITSLKKIEHTKGLVMHAMKNSDSSYVGFGEAYFSSVNHGMCKGWKLHKKMTLNLIVPSGDIRFVVHGANQSCKANIIEPLIDTTIGENNYSRLTIPPGFWVAFQGVGLGQNILLNIADLEHDPEEAFNVDLNFFTVKGFDANE